MFLAQVHRLEHTLVQLQLLLKDSTLLETPATLATFYYVPNQ